MIAKGIPAMAPTMVIVKIIPTSIKAKPKITATNRPVSMTIQAIKFHIQTNGLNSQ